MIRHLSRRHEVFVVSLAHTQQEIDEGAGLKEHCAEICSEVVPEKLRWLQAVRALLSATPSSVAYFNHSRLRHRIQELKRRVAFDAVIVHCAFAAQYGMDVPAKTRLMDFGDLDSGKWLDYSKCRAFPLSLGYGLEGRKLRRYEKKVATAFDYCTLTTQGELEEFKTLNIGRPHTVIPNGVDDSYFQPNGRLPEGKPVIVFLGRMDYYPNIDGVLHFTKNIFPAIQAVVPDVEFRIVGSNPSSAIGRLRQISGITVTGYVPDVRLFMKDAVVSVAPLRMARGTQNKILESMAMGVPVVATPQAAKGIQATPGRHLLIGDTPESFAAQVSSVLQNCRLREDLSRAGRTQVLEGHNWAASMAVLDGILKNGKSVVTTGTS